MLAIKPSLPESGTWAARAPGRPIMDLTSTKAGLMLGAQGWLLFALQKPKLYRSDQRENP